MKWTLVNPLMKRNNRTGIQIMVYQYVYNFSEDDISIKEVNKPMNILFT